jgi:eukaryotic-like serine/threonine-protein kinase
MNNQRLGSFRIEVRLDSQPVGSVFRGVHEPTGTTVAIKLLTGDEGIRLSRFERAAKILWECNHPNIPRVLEFGRLGEVTYLAMEYITGRTLAEVLAERRLLPWPEVVEMGAQICEALRHIHERGVVHRNLNPSHLMLTEQGQVKLIGFGIAKDVDQILPASAGIVLGTPAYLAPEQIRGTPLVSQQTDLYALGIVLYEMLVGKPPFEGRTPILLIASHLNERAPRASDRLAGIPKALDTLIAKLLAKSPHERPQDAAEVQAVLTQLRDAESPQLVEKAPLEDRPPRRDQTLLARLLNSLRGRNRHG